MTVSSAGGASVRRLHRIARLLAVVLCLGLPAMFMARPAYAAVLVVNSSTDAASDGVCDVTPNGCTIRDALAVAAGAAGPDTITFDPAVTSITLTQGTLVIPADVTITGDATNRTTLTAAVAGQRIMSVATGPVQLDNLTLNGNFAGSGLSNAATGTGTSLVVNNIRVVNTAGGGALTGGAIVNTGTMTVNGASFTVNGAGTGGSIANDAGGTLTLTNADVGGSSAGSGGAILNRGTLVASTCLVSTSSTTSGAGGGFLNEGGTATFTNCTFSGNIASGPDGAPRNGGGIAVTGGSVVLNSVTVGANTAQDIGGGIAVSGAGSTVTIKATLVAANTGGDIATLSDGAITSAGYNLIGNTGGTTIGGIATGNITNVNARVASLASIPLTSLATHALLPGSPAIDAVPATECPANDQRGIVRANTSGAATASTPCDIGAFESSGFEVSVTSGDGQSALVGEAFANRVVLQITSKAPVGQKEPTGSGTLTFTGPPATGATIIPRTGTVTAASNGEAEIDFLTANTIAGDNYTVQIGGKGIATPAALTLSNTTNAVAGFSSTPAPGSAISFGLATVGTSVNRGISVSESGSGTLQVSNIALSGPNAADFNVTPTSFNIVDGGAAVNVTVTCTPSAAAVRTATLTITHNAAGSPATYSLTCEGTLTALPAYSSTPAPNGTLDVGAAPIGVATSAPLNVTNAGAAPLTVSSVAISGAAAGEFSVTPGTLTIAAGATQPLAVSCTPASTGTRSATLTVEHNASGSPAVYTLTCSSNGMFLPLVGN